MINKYFKSDHGKCTIYQLLLRVFSNSKTRNKAYGSIAENGVGKFNDITAHVLASLKDLGVSHIWYTGVLEHSSMTGYEEFGIAPDIATIVKGRAGSPYAIRDYYDVDADLAENVGQRMEEFSALIKRTHDAALKVIIDFVPNHVARSYHSDKNPGRQPDFGEKDDTRVLFKPDNNFLYLHDGPFQVPAGYHPLGGKKLPAKWMKYTENPAKVTGNDVYSSSPSMNDWFETIKLNFGVDPHPPHKVYFDPVPLTWLQLLDILLYWCEKGVDGFRCDMAEMVPAEFWEWIIPCVKTRFPEVVFIAEIYKPDVYAKYLETGYFDYLYDKVHLYDTLVSVLRGETPADALSGTVKCVEHYSERMLSFLENHDEIRLASRHFLGDARAAWPAMVVCATVSKGPVMIYCGQELGVSAAENIGFAGDTGRTSIFDYGSVDEIQRWFNKGKCDGALLSAEQQSLRNSYKKLLHMVRSCKAVSDGGFYDLQYINRHHQSEGFDERYLFAFIRHCASEKIVIVVNFNKTQSYKAHIRIPPEALQHCGIGKKEVLVFTDLLDEGISVAVEREKLYRQGDRFSGLMLDLKPLGAFILKIQ